jgi:hypothetical protein
MKLTDVCKEGAACMCILKAYGGHSIVSITKKPKTCVLQITVF